MKIPRMVCMVVMFPILTMAQVSAPENRQRPAQMYVAADPVELSVGYYFRRYDDFFVSDSMPIHFYRSQRNMDKRQRTFGMGGSSSFDMFIYGDSKKFSWVALFMPDGGDERFERISPGTGYTDGVFENRTSPTEYGGARVRWKGGWFGFGGHWLVERRDGTEISIKACSPSSKPGQCAVFQVKNRAGEILTVDRDGDGNLVKITSPHQHSIRFTHDGMGRIIHAASDSGDWLVYSYDKTGCLIKAMNSRGDVQRFKYDADFNMTEIREVGPAHGEDPAYDFLVLNEYDRDGRTTAQKLSDGRFFKFSYVAGEDGLNREADVVDNIGTTKYFFTDGYIAHEEYTSSANSSWTLDFTRDPRVNAQLGAKISCAGGRQLELPSDAARLINQMGEEHKQIISKLCRNSLNGLPPGNRNVQRGGIRSAKAGSAGGDISVQTIR
jgi:YD repeat-containing protein